MTNVQRTTQDAQHGTVDDIPLPPPRPLPGPPTGPTVAVSAAAAGQPALVRIARTNMARAITRLSFAVERSALPAPRGIRFADRAAVVVLEFDTIAEATAWAEELGAVASGRETAEMLGEVRFRMYTASALWRGFSVTLTACTVEKSEPAAVSA